MIIESIKLTRGNNCFIVLDSGDELTISVDIAVENRLKKGSEIGDELLSAIKARQNLIDAKRIAHNYLSYRPRSEFEVRRKLKDKGFGKEVADETVRFLYEFNFLDDSKYAKAFARDLLKRKPAGKMKVTAELKKRGIDEALIEKTVDEIFADQDEAKLIRAASEKKLRQVSYKTVEKQKTALAGFLQRQGFSYEAIDEAIKEHFR